VAEVRPFRRGCWGPRALYNLSGCTTPTAPSGSGLASLVATLLVHGPVPPEPAAATVPRPHPLTQ